MPTKGPTVDADLARLAEGAHNDSRAAFEAALHQAWEMGWRAHASAIAEFDRPPLDPVQLDTAAEAPEITASASALPPTDTQQAVVLDAVRRRPTGATSMQIISAVQAVDRHMSAAAVRTNLHRLKLKTLITAQGGKWFPVPTGTGDTGVAAPVHILHQNQRRV